MHYEADLIVLDEPTAALAVKEVRKVLDFVRRIKDSGRACVISSTTSHMCTRSPTGWSSLSRGTVAAEVNPKDMTVAELTEYLIALQHKT
jgi:simple sugar transport system ATP-binding protein